MNYKRTSSVRSLLSLLRSCLYDESICTAIELDADGIQPSVLRETLENWPTSKPQPKALYTVPVRLTFIY